MTASTPAAAFVEFVCTPFAPGYDGAWTFDLWITVPLALSALLYATGTAAIWRRAGIGRGIHSWRVGCYVAGWLTLAVALVSPVHHWGTGLFTIHMIEHELVMALAAPLLVLGRPGAAMTWALPPSVRRRLGPLLRRSGIRAAWSSLTQPLAATLLHGVAVWVWHVPLWFEMAVANVALHRLQHVSFTVTGLLFWWALLRRRNAGIAAAHLFATMLHTSILGAIVALAPHVLYRLQTGGAAQWGLTPLQDQQLAGLIMWIPAGAVYATAALLFFARWVRRSGEITARSYRSEIVDSGAYP